MNRSEAQRQSLKTYNTGVPCKNGHSADRSTATGSCIECATARSARFYEQHGVEYRREKSTAHYQQNKQTYVDRGVAWQRDNPEKVSAIRRRTNKAFRAEHPEYAAEWWKQHPERAEEYAKRQYARAARRNWRQANKGHQNFLTRMRQKHVRQATPSWADRDQLKLIYIEAGERSVREGIEYHVDHIIPLRGELVCGLHTPANLQILTKHDNLKKGRKYQVSS